LLPEHIRGKTVWDLGSGDCLRANKLLKMGAAQVYAVDKEPFAPSRPSRGLTWVHSLFKDLEVPQEGFQVAWVAWPQNCPLPGLVRLLEAAEVVIYLGCNTGGTSCGNPELFEHFRTREVLAEILVRQNCLTVYGAVTRRYRAATLEEAVVREGEMLSFELAFRRYGGPAGFYPGG